MLKKSERVKNFEWSHLRNLYNLYDSFQLQLLLDRFE